VGELAISQDIPDATVAYGRSETSATIRINVVRAAGSERGPRGFVTAFLRAPDPAP